MKEKIMDTFKKIAKIMSYYRTLLILWFVLGIFVMACGDISRLNYFCVWILLLMEYLDRCIDEVKKNKENER